MKSLPFILFAIVSVSVIYESGLVDAAEEKSCKAIMSDLTKRQFAGISGCTKSMKFKNGKDKAKKMNCIMKCALEREGVLNPEGLLERATVDVLILREFPPSLVEKANKTFTPCIEVAMGKLDPNPETDPYCASYDPPLKCAMAGLPTVSFSITPASDTSICMKVEELSIEELSLCG